MTQTIPNKMEAAQIVKFGDTDYRFNTVSTPEPTGFEYLIKVGAAGYCHTDSMVAHGDYESIGSTCPITGSHEPVGTIVAMGSDAQKLHRHQVGDRIGAYCLKAHCGTCADCTVFGDATFCTQAQGFVGLNLNGGFAEYCIVDSRSSVSLPDSMSFIQAAPLMCAGVTVYKSIRKAEEHGLRPGGTVGFSGMGALGHLGAQFAKVMGYKVVAIDNRPEPLELAESLQYPPDVILNAESTSAEDAAAAIKKVKGDKPFDGLDAAILLADPQDSFDYAIKLLARHGLLVLISQPAEGINISFMDLVFRDVRLVSSLLGSTQDLQETVDLCDKFQIKSDVTTYDFKGLNQLVKDSHSKTRKGKSVVKFSE